MVGILVGNFAERLPLKELTLDVSQDSILLM